MKRSPECRPRIWDGLVVLAVAALAIVTAAAVWGGEAERVEAVVSIDGAEVERFPLDGVGEHVYTAGGYTVRFLETEDGGICALSSDCPTQDCVHTGTIRRPGQSIVCLPARLSVTLRGGEAAVDAVIG